MPTLLSDDAPKCYLAGPITGNECDVQWRLRAAAMLRRQGWGALDPMAGLDNAQIGDLGLSVGGQPVGADVARRDIATILRAEAMLIHVAYLPDRPMVGTWAEMGFAFACGLTIAVCTPFALIARHPFVLHCADAITDQLDDAVARLVADYQLIAEMEGATDGSDSR